MIIFICIYLLIGIGIQVVGQLLSDEFMAKSVDAFDVVVFNDYPDHEENLREVGELKTSKFWILIHTVLWPVNILIGVWFYIKLVLYFRKKK